MDDTFGVDVDVEPNDIFEGVANETFVAEGYMCDNELKRILFRQPRSQGSLIRICVRPTQTALDAGVFMRRIDSFAFQREGLKEGEPISQVAISGGRANELSELFCERGSDLCYFETVLSSEFYFNLGTVFGFGEAWLQVCILDSLSVSVLSLL